jgi:predicted CXXCH cytochrome family protein
MKMLKFLFVMASVMFVSSAAQAVISGSSHDLTSKTSTTGAELCVFCHTPHGGTTDAPLWNRTGPATTTFTTYSSDTLDTGTAGVAPQPSGISAQCLSCHDGATAYLALTNNPAYTMTTANMSASTFSLDTDLSNDHPVSIDYVTLQAAQTGEFRAASGVNTQQVINGGTTLQLYSDKVECASCHNPHLTDNGSFLRASNDGSAICLACHTK